MPESAQSSELVSSSGISTDDNWSDHDKRLLVQLCIPEPRNWSCIIAAFQKHAEYLRSIELITKQWGLLMCREPGLIQEVQADMEASGNQHSILRITVTIQRDTATPKATEAVKPGIRSEADTDPEQFLLDEVQLNQEQFYTLQGSMDSALLYEQPSQIVAQLKREERGL